MMIRLKIKWKRDLQPTITHLLIGVNLFTWKIKKHKMVSYSEYEYIAFHKLTIKVVRAYITNIRG